MYRRNRWYPLKFRKKRFFIPLGIAALFVFTLVCLRHLQMKRLIYHTIPDYSVRRSGPGENGAGIILNDSESKISDQQMQTWFMNVLASDRISLDRSIPDYRSDECRMLRYDEDLPVASVIIIFTDEAWSPLLRTVHSVVSRSPPRYLKEVILVDDFSQREELKNKLDEHIKRFGGLVRIVRLDSRQGLIRAKLAGAAEATGEVIVFLDSHCEANTGW
ncbi:hypothetical protein AB6A40_005432 [Gnathostoma spinigerum]|uniref:Glycosyltransferase 2-like domain-containing protein n=1 Tax=Gnathostoma spinigerum TaxID=75299 RepID=A0ABD6EFK1_9BILA